MLPQEGKCVGVQMASAWRETGNSLQLLDDLDWDDGGGGLFLGLFHQWFCNFRGCHGLLLLGFLGLFLWWFYYLGGCHGHLLLGFLGEIRTVFIFGSPILVDNKPGIASATTSAITKSTSASIVFLGEISSAAFCLIGFFCEKKLLCKHHLTSSHQRGQHPWRY